MNIYLDMDDVVADWMGYARAYLKEPNWREGEMLPEYKWRRLKDDQRMYRNLPLKEGAHDLVNWCRAYKEKSGCGLFFLSAIPHGNDMPWAIQDKVFWAQEHFPDIPVFLGPYSHDKWVRCIPGDILIDDRKGNNEDWKRQGGRAFLYKNWPECKLWLEQELGSL